jgi:hypothetical protein
VTVANPTYAKLLQILNDNCYGEPVQLAWGSSIDILNAIWPEIVGLLATIVEYEHALEHVADSHMPATCPDCQSLAQSALNGVNREMCREIINDS